MLDQWGDRDLKMIARVIVGVSCPMVAVGKSAAIDLGVGSNPLLDEVIGWSL